MRKDITIVAEPRQERGKGPAHRMRAAGMIPAVLYGAGAESVPVKVNPKEVNRILHSSTGHNTIFNVDLQGFERTPAMVVDWQREPIKDTLLHVDLMRIDLAKRLRVKIPIRTEGESVGVKTFGGLLELVTREVEVECLPDEIPEFFTVNVQELMIGQNIRASDLPLPGSMTLVSPADTVLCHVIAMRATEEAAEETAAAAEPAAAEPEVAKKGKKEEPAGDEKAKKK